MKFFTYFSFLILAFTSFSAPYAYAQEAIDSYIDEEMTSEEYEGVGEGGVEEILSLEEIDELINSLPTSADAAKGTVPTDIGTEYYDIYSRTLAFRENIKELRVSLEARRIEFENPRIETLEAYRKLKEKVYAAEKFAYEESQNSIEMDNEIEGYNSEGTLDDEYGADLTEENSSSNGEDDKEEAVTSEDSPDLDPYDM